MPFVYIDILILAELSSRPYHGYELKRQVEWILSETLNSNHLYPALRRYEEMGAIYHEVERQSGRPDRHVYHLTEQGKDVLRTLLRDFSPDLARSDSEFQTRVAFFHLLDRNRHAMRELHDTVEDLAEHFDVHERVQAAVRAAECAPQRTGGSRPSRR